MGDSKDESLKEIAKKLVEESGEKHNVDDLVQKAKKLVEDNKEGIGDMRKLSFAIGMPSPSIFLREMITHSTAPKSKKKLLLNKIPNCLEFTDRGCIQIDFYDTTEKKTRRARLFLGECESGHDLSAELEKLYCRIPTQKHDEIRKHLSMLIYLGRAVFNSVIAKNEPFIRQILEHLPEGYNPFILFVDPKNTTLYIPLGQTKRVGIFVETDDI